MCGSLVVGSYCSCGSLVADNYCTCVVQLVSINILPFFNKMADDLDVEEEMQTTDIEEVRKQIW